MSFRNPLKIMVKKSLEFELIEKSTSRRHSVKDDTTRVHACTRVDGQEKKNKE